MYEIQPQSLYGYNICNYGCRFSPIHYSLAHDFIDCLVMLESHFTINFMCVGYDPVYNSTILLKHKNLLQWPKRNQNTNLFKL